MKHLLIGIAAGVAITTIVLTIPGGTAKYVRAQQPVLSAQQEAWTAALRWCESRGKDTAINKVDRDGTPSYGRYQFKPGTFEGYAQAYGIATTSAGVMDGTVQQEILERMMLDKSISAHSWEHQLFPDCIQHYIGLPPSH